MAQDQINYLLTSLKFCKNVIFTSCKHFQPFKSYGILKFQLEKSGKYPKNQKSAPTDRFFQQWPPKWHQGSSLGPLSLEKKFRQNRGRGAKKLYNHIKRRLLQ